MHSKVEHQTLREGLQSSRTATPECATPARLLLRHDKHIFRMRAHGRGRPLQAAPSTTASPPAPVRGKSTSRFPEWGHPDIKSEKQPLGVNRELKFGEFGCSAHAAGNRRMTLREARITPARWSRARSTRRKIDCVAFQYATLPPAVATAAHSALIILL